MRLNAFLWPSWPNGNKIFENDLSKRGINASKIDWEASSIFSNNIIEFLSLNSESSISKTILENSVSSKENKSLLFRLIFSFPKSYSIVVVSVNWYFISL